MRAPKGSDLLKLVGTCSHPCFGCHPRVDSSPHAHVFESWSNSAPTGPLSTPSANHNLFSVPKRLNPSPRCPQSHVPRGLASRTHCSAHRLSPCCLCGLHRTSWVCRLSAHFSSPPHSGAQHPLQLTAQPIAPQLRARTTLQPRSLLPCGTLHSQFERQDVPHPEPTTDSKRLPRCLASG